MIVVPDKNQFQHIIRLLNTNIDGRRNIVIINDSHNFNLHEIIFTFRVHYKLQKTNKLKLKT